MTNTLRSFHHGMEGGPGPTDPTRGRPMRCTGKGGGTSGRPLGSFQGPGGSASATYGRERVVPRSRARCFSARTRWSWKNQRSLHTGKKRTVWHSPCSSPSPISVRPPFGWTAGPRHGIKPPGRGSIVRRRWFLRPVSCTGRCGSCPPHPDTASPVAVQRGVTTSISRPAAKPARSLSAPLPPLVLVPPFRRLHSEPARNPIFVPGGRMDWPACPASAAPAASSKQFPEQGRCRIQGMAV